MHIHFIRHGQTQWNVEGRLQGVQDIPLSHKGHLQAKQLGDRMRQWPIDVIISSPLQRARNTAQMLGDSFVTMHDVREIELGQWEGLTLKELFEQNPSLAQYSDKDVTNRRAPGGESYEDVLKRAKAALETIVATHSEAAHIVVVSHGGFIKSLITDILNMDLAYRKRLSIGNTSITTIKKHPTHYELVRHNDTAHLENYQTGEE